MHSRPVVLYSTIGLCTYTKIEIWGAVRIHGLKLKIHGSQVLEENTSLTWSTSAPFPSTLPFPQYICVGVEGYQSAIYFHQVTQFHEVIGYIMYCKAINASRQWKYLDKAGCIFGVSARCLIDQPAYGLNTTYYCHSSVCIYPINKNGKHCRGTIRTESLIINKYAHRLSSVKSIK